MVEDILAIAIIVYATARIYYILKRVWGGTK